MRSHQRISPKNSKPKVEVLSVSVLVGEVREPYIYLLPTSKDLPW